MATSKVNRIKETNPFYGRASQEGIDTIGDPDRTSGRTKVTNPYVDRDTKKKKVHRRRGRPKHNTTSITPTVVKSIRLPPEVWEQVDRQATREGKNRHAALREAVLIWLQS